MYGLGLTPLPPSYPTPTEIPLWQRIIRGAEQVFGSPAYSTYPTYPPITYPGGEEPQIPSDVYQIPKYFDVPLQTNWLLIIGAGVLIYLLTSKR
jgi:hypothetical protein